MTWQERLWWSVEDDLGIRTPNESNDPYYGHLKMSWTRQRMTWQKKKDIGPNDQMKSSKKDQMTHSEVFGVGPNTLDKDDVDDKEAWQVTWQITRR